MTNLRGRCPLAATCLLIILVSPSSLLAWGQAGHQTIGAIADQLLAGSRAEKEIRALLRHGETLISVSIWAYCTKGYCQAPLSPDMKTFTKANPNHHEYHYTDITFQKAEYEAGAIGSDPNDVDRILGQCIRVLLGNETPESNPHQFTPRVALLLLAHLVGICISRYM